MTTPMKRLTSTEIEKFLTNVVSGNVVGKHSYHINIKTNEIISLTSFKKKLERYCKDNNISILNINVCNTDIFNNLPKVRNKKLFTIYIGNFVIL